MKAIDYLTHQNQTKPNQTETRCLEWNVNCGDQQNPDKKANWAMHLHSSYFVTIALHGFMPASCKSLSLEDTDTEIFMDEIVSCLEFALNKFAGEVTGVWI